MGARSGFRNRGAVVESEPLVKLRAEAALADAIGIEVSCDRGAATRGPAESPRRAAEMLRRIAGGREPLHLVLVGVGVEAEQFRDAAVQIAERIRIVQFLFQTQLVAFARASARRSENRPCGRA